MGKIKAILGMLMLFGGIGTALCCIIAVIVFTVKNPDMTELRRFIEYPEPVVIGVMSAIIARFGMYMIVKGDE